MYHRWHKHKILKRLLCFGAVGIVLLVLLELVKKCPKLSTPEKRPQRPSGRSDCQPVSSGIYKRPDPLIYDQYYLMAQGIAVSWDNPDIHLEQNGVTVDSHDLQPGATYEVVARVWNGSTDAPVAQLPVHLSYLSFGIGTVSHPIGTTYIDLGVKGSIDCPSYAQVNWTTPITPGHYCLQVDLQWKDDANPADNLGQQNTDVQALNSPNAQFTFPLANRVRTARRVTLRADAYAIPEAGPCGTGEEATTLRRRRVASQQIDAQTLPSGWNVTITPSSLDLQPGDEQTVTVDVAAPDGFIGAQSFNVSASADGTLNWRRDADSAQLGG